MSQPGNWFCVLDGQEVGPLRPDEIVALRNGGRIQPSTPVRHEKGSWAEARQVPGLIVAGRPAQISTGAQSTPTNDAPKKGYGCLAILAGGVVAAPIAAARHGDDLDVFVKFVDRYGGVAIDVFEWCQYLIGG